MNYNNLSLDSARLCVFKNGVTIKRLDSIYLFFVRFFLVLCILWFYIIFILYVLLYGRNNFHSEIASKFHK